MMPSASHKDLSRTQLELSQLVEKLKGCSLHFVGETKYLIAFPTFEIMIDLEGYP